MPKADRFFLKGPRNNERKVIDKTIVRNVPLIFASGSEHLGKIDQDFASDCRSLKAPRQRVQTFSAWSGYSLLNACNRREYLKDA